LELGRIVQMDWRKGVLLPNAEVRDSIKTLGQMDKIFLNEDARRAMDPQTVVYRVQGWYPVPEGTEGAQFWGTTEIQPGQVDSEYFMTYGHFHQKRDRTEYYSTVDGEGALILMGEDRETRMEPMSAGSLHFVPPNTAHRVANTGKVPLRVVACWPSDAGHDYDLIRMFGFGARLLNVRQKPLLVKSK
jgi:glucose-6-phosphate isomerase